MDFIPTIFDQTTVSDKRIIVGSERGTTRVGIVTTVPEEETTNEEQEN